MGNKAGIALLGMSGLLILFATYASLLPDVLASKTTIKVTVPPSEVVRHLSTAGDWEDWMFSHQVKSVGEWRTLVSGKNSGEGSVLKWFSKVLGDGGLEIKTISNNKVVFERISDGNAFRDRGYFFIDSIAEGTDITFLDSLDVSTNFMARYEAQDSSYIEKINASNLEMLQRLKKQLEQKK